MIEQAFAVYSPLIFVERVLVLEMQLGKNRVQNSIYTSHSCSTVICRLDVELECTVNALALEEDKEPHGEIKTSTYPNTAAQ